MTIENINFEKISFSEIGVIYKANENDYFESHRKDAINEGCILCTFRNNCPVNKKNCYVTFTKPRDIPYYRDLQNNGLLILRSGK